MAAFRGLGIGNWRSNRDERLFPRNLACRLPEDAVILDIGANRRAYATEQNVPTFLILIK